MGYGYCSTDSLYQSLARTVDWCYRGLAIRASPCCFAARAGMIGRIEHAVSLVWIRIHRRRHRTVSPLRESASDGSARDNSRWGFARPRADGDAIPTFNRLLAFLQLGGGLLSLPGLPDLSDLSKPAHAARILCPAERAATVRLLCSTQRAAAAYLVRPSQRAICLPTVWTAGSSGVYAPATTASPPARPDDRNRLKCSGGHRGGRGLWGGCVVVAYHGRSGKHAWRADLLLRHGHAWSHRHHPARAAHALPGRFFVQHERLVK